MTRGPVKAPTKSLGLVIWGSWMHNFMVIHPIVRDTYSAPKWWINQHLHSSRDAASCSIQGPTVGHTWWNFDRAGKRKWYRWDCHTKFSLCWNGLFQRTSGDNSVKSCTTHFHVFKINPSNVAVRAPRCLAWINVSFVLKIQCRNTRLHTRRVEIDFLPSVRKYCQRKRKRLRNLQKNWKFTSQADTTLHALLICSTMQLW